MEEILKALLGGASGNSGKQETNSSQAIIDLVGGILGGGNAPQSPPTSPSQPSQQEANPIADLIGSILGGAMTPVQPQAQGQPAQQAENPIADLIGGLIGGASQQGSGNVIADLLGSMMGGGSSSSSNAESMNPIAQLLSDKLGLSPAVAQAVVTFFMAKMVEMIIPRLTGGQAALPEGTPQGGGGGLNLDHLLNNVDDEEGLNLQLSASGMPQELSSATGLDEETATQSLQELVKLVAQQRQQSEPAQSQSGRLDHLLDNWETQ